MNFALIPTSLEEGEPTLTIRSICLDCGEMVMETTYDVEGDTDQDVTERGIADGEACVKHWRERHDPQRN